MTLAAASRLRILAVEDDPLQVRVLRFNLLEMGFDPPLTARAAAEAEALFRAELPDVVLLDIHIEGDTDGITLAGRLRAIMPSVRFIFLSATTDRATVERARATSPQGFLTKPYDPQALHALIQQATTAA